MKLHEILIGIVAMSMVVSGFMLFLNAGIDEYSVTETNSSTFDAFTDSLDNMTVIADETKDAMSDLEGNPSATDMLGAFVTSSYGAAKVTTKSFGVFFSLIGASISPLPLGSFGNILIGGLSTMLILIIVVGILLHIVTKSDRT